VDVQPNADVVHDEVIWPVGHAARRADGTYEGFVLPGPGAVLVKTRWTLGYRPAHVDPKAFFAPGRTNWTEEEQISAYGTHDTLTTCQGRYIDTIYRGSTLDQRDYTAIVLVNPPPKSGPLQLAATVVRDRPRRVSLVDPDGKPVVGAEMREQIRWPAFDPLHRKWVAGIQTQETKLRAASFPLTGLHPDRIQHITFVKEDRQLIGLLLARGESDLPYTVRMQPWGTVTGRIIDEKGKPLSAADQLIWDTGIRTKGDGSDSCEQDGGKTDTQGRFRVERFIPGLSYSAEVYHKNRVIGTAKLVLRAGEIRDLGDFQAKPPADGK
jgi:hypothetical protein